MAAAVVPPGEVTSARSRNALFSDVWSRIPAEPKDGLLLTLQPR